MRWWRLPTKVKMNQAETGEEIGVIEEKSDPARYVQTRYEKPMGSEMAQLPGAPLCVDCFIQHLFRQVSPLGKQQRDMACQR